MPVNEFLDHFLPITETGDPPSSQGAFADVPARCVRESDICVPLVSSKRYLRSSHCKSVQVAALNQNTPSESHGCPRFVFESTPSRRSRLTRLGDMRPHICCYTSDNLLSVGHVHASPRVELGYAELFIEVRPDAAGDIFVDPPSDADATARQAHNFLTSPGSTMSKDELVATLGKHIALAVEVLARQQRVFLFSIAVFGSLARFLRWDRAGCVVSEAFDFREQPQHLCQFIWRFAMTSDLGRGHDSTIRLASTEEENIFHNAIKKHISFELRLPDEGIDLHVAQHYEKDHVFAVDLLHHRFTAREENTRRFFVSRPVVTPLFLANRGTRGYWAVDSSSHEVVFLKDTWRLTTSWEVEGDTLRRLTDVGVRYVPSLVWHGDVPSVSLDKTHKLASEYFFHVSS